MIDEPKVVQTAAQPTAVIRLTVPREKIQEVMVPGYSELMEALKVQGVAPSGPWFTHHLKMDPAVFDFEIGVPVATAVNPAGRVMPGALRAAKVARTVYHGSYGGLPGAWAQFDAWIAVNGYNHADDLWEVYAAGPESGSDSSKWQTELNRPLAP